VIKTAYNIIHNAFIAFNDDSGCKSLFPLYHITPFCNLKCSYCEGFPELGLPKDKAQNYNIPDNHKYELSTTEVKKLLSILRKSFDYFFYIFSY
jgi:MoaA/NifB/PqqE/SkfB family radical SAM enzyme